MPKKIEAPIGVRFGRLTVESEAEPAVRHDGYGIRRMNCTCDCGTKLTARLGNLRSGNTASCGCYVQEKAAALNKTHGQASTRYRTRNYKLWTGIKNRAVTGSSSGRKNYLDRGISLYGPWQRDFVAFDTWLNENLGPCPEGKSLDRIDNNGSYEPGNLQWATPSEQANNTRRNVMVTYNEQTKTIAQWARLLGVGATTLNYRLFKANWPVEKALTTPVRQQ